MRITPAQRAERRRLLAISDEFAYEGATRVHVCEVIPTGPHLQAALQAVYTTPDSLDFVDYWYRERLEFGSDSPTAGVAFRVDGRRWSFFRDGLTYRKVPALRRRPLRVRQYVFEASGARLVVLACRQPDEPVTLMAVTVLPGEAALDAEPGAAADPAS